MTIIETSNLRKVYGGRLTAPVEALRGIDLSVKGGQAFGLLGPNGAGKTTLIKILMGLVNATEGSAILLGKPAGHTVTRLRVGYMPECRAYPDFLTAFQVLDLFGRMLGMPATQRRKRAGQLLEEVGMSKWRNHKVGGYSKGMIQRLALAQALVPNPEVLFLDEPTEGIDPLGRVTIRRVLRRRLEHGSSLFLSSHMLTEVEMICDQVAILAEGKIARSGPLDSLTTTELQYRVTVAGIDNDVFRETLDETVDAAEPLKAPEGLCSWRLSVRDRSVLNAALDRLRHAGAEIEEVVAERTSLEDVFIQAIRQPNGAGADTARQR